MEQEIKMPIELPKVKIKGSWYFQDNRLREFRKTNNPHERITFEEYRQQGLEIEDTDKPILEQTGITKDFDVFYKGKKYHLNYTNADGQTLALVNRDYWEITDDEGEELSTDTDENIVKELINFCIEHFDDYENQLKNDDDSLKRIE